jgi:transketolase
VSLPSWFLFGRQDADYRREVLGPPTALRVSVEAGVAVGWERWLGDGGVAVGLDRFGASAPGREVMAKLGFTAEAVAQRVRSALASRV